MTKKQRFLELVRLILAQQVVHDEDVLAAYDCFMAMPDACIPDKASLRYFAHDAIDLFLVRADRCQLNYARAARYIQKWRSTWKVSPAEPGPSAGE